MIAGEDLTGDLYRVVTMNTDGEAVLATAAGDYCLGVVAMNPNLSQGNTASSENNPVRIALLDGIVTIEAGGAIAAGDLVHAAANGQIVSAGANIAALAAGDYVIGQAMEAASAAGEQISVFARPFLHAA
jgi:hypothetical protein